MASVMKVVRVVPSWSHRSFNALLRLVGIRHVIMLGLASLVALNCKFGVDFIIHSSYVLFLGFVCKE